MNQTLSITKALADETRLRILMILADGELCLCQIAGVFPLAPSTLSRHLAILAQAGLVGARKQGRWRYFHLAGSGARPEVRRALGWVRKALAEDPSVRADARRLRRILRKGLEEATACYRA